MALKKIRETRVSPKCSVRIYRDREMNEYVVKTVILKRVDSGAFETDLASARSTAAAQVRWLRKRASCR